MYKVKDLHKYSQTLNILYVEDDKFLRANLHALLSPLFASVDLAEDGLDGLKKYNNYQYDLVITDINMPKMSGIEMTEEIRTINPEQKIISVSAHNEGDILIDLIRAGVNSFILKPILQDEIINTLYPVCRDAHAQNMNIELLNTLQEDKEKLLKQNRELKAQSNTIETKHKQLGDLLEKKEQLSSPAGTDEYFKKDEDEGVENVLLLSDHCADLIEMFDEIPILIGISNTISEADILIISEYFRKSANIFTHYAPYVDLISDSFIKLSLEIKENSESFKELVEHNQEALLMLFDAISSDMERYVKRFQVESLAMKNAHHIHRPTALSIEQIIDLISPSETDYGEIELF